MQKKFNNYLFPSSDHVNVLCLAVSTTIQLVQLTLESVLVKIMWSHVIVVNVSLDTSTFRKTTLGDVLPASVIFTPQYVLLLKDSIWTPLKAHLIQVCDTGNTNIIYS